ncbi:hypothetical protein MMC30_007530 [Trapelia coarctata]|nr:hypothetical protein [Trapelia coarctata]
MSSSQTATDGPAENAGPTPEESLNDMLTRFRPLDMNEIRWSKMQLGRANWSVSSIAEHYLRSQINNCDGIDGTHDGDGKASGNVRSLAAMSTAKIGTTLSASTELRADIITVAQNLRFPTLRQLLKDERTPYKVLRAFLDHSLQSSLPSWAVSVCRSQDIDDAILRQDRYIRSVSHEHNKDGAYLLSLEDLTEILEDQSEKIGSTFTIERKDPPLGGFELFDERRNRYFDMLGDHKTYSDTFHRVTSNILEGLDWNNVMVAGDMALATLMHAGECKDKDQIENFGIVLYLHGLDAQAANKKVEEIHGLWERNLPVTNDEVAVVKNNKSISFLANYAYPRILIILKLFSSPTDILSSLELDQCAIGFDGHRVLMLPRCARAIETGFSVLTMALLHPHENWPGYLYGLICAWANRGFGLRILPVYAKSLEEDPCAEDFGKIWTRALKDGNGDTDVYVNQNIIDGNSSPGSDLPSFPAPSDEYISRDSYRMPDGPEPGLKTLKRAAYLGQDYTGRYCFHNTPLDVPSIRRLASRTGWNPDYEERKRITRDRITKHKYMRAIRINQRIQEPRGAHLQGLMEIDDYRFPKDLPDGMPDGRMGLTRFEFLTRLAEAWRLKVTDQISYDDPWPSSTLNDSDDFNDSSDYFWNEDFRPYDIEEAIHMSNNDLFDILKDGIYSGYLTRRIRRQIHGPDLKSVMDKQITIPLLVPPALENFLSNELPRLCPDLPSHYLSKAFLIPVHDTAKYDPAAARNPLLKVLPDEASEQGNLRYWVITNESMWTRQHRAMDEVFTVLWSLFRWFQHEDTPNTCNVPEATWHLARSLRRRALHPKVAAFLGPKHSDHERSLTCNTKRKFDTGLDARETLLFREWVLTIPHTTGRMDEDPPEFEEDGYLYPVPEELFWKEGDEGKWDGGEVPEWITVREDDEETVTKGTCVKRKRAVSLDGDAGAAGKKVGDVHGNGAVDVNGMDEEVDVGGEGDVDGNGMEGVDMGGEGDVEMDE